MEKIIKAPCQEVRELLARLAETSSPELRQQILEGLQGEMRVEVEAAIGPSPNLLPASERLEREAADRKRISGSGGEMPALVERLGRLAELRAEVEGECLREIMALQADLGIELVVQVKAKDAAARGRLEAVLAEYQCRLVPTFRAEWEG